MEVHEAYKNKMVAQLKEWSAQIDLLEAKMVGLGADISLKRAEQIKTLRKMHVAASEKLTELDAVTEQAWDDVKSTTDKMWGEFKDGIEKVRTSLR